MASAQLENRDLFDSMKWYLKSDEAICRKLSDSRASS